MVQFVFARDWCVCCKRKTACEVGISDGGSAVCSSDLRWLAPCPPPTLSAFWRGKCGKALNAHPEWTPRTAISARQQAIARSRRRRSIRRASFREQDGQYV